MPSLSQVIELLNKRINHTFLVIYKDGRETELTGYELKQKLLAGEITLDELKDIQDLTYLEQVSKRIKPLPKSEIEARIRQDKMKKTVIKFLKVLAGLVILVVILRRILR